MSSDDPKTLGRARLSFASEAEIDEFVSTLSRYERGELSPAEWRAYRLVRGTYGQRQDYDAQMLRVKVPQGVLSSAQLRALAEVGERFSRGFGHITTRQNFQFHFVKLHDVERAMRVLAAEGLTTREACGNSVRNITACPFAGVVFDEPFDVTPYAEALTRYLLRHPLTSSLPRKFKIALEGCLEDHSYTSVNDVGLRARIRGAERGFRVTVGGGTAIRCTSGSVLHDFAPAGELFEILEAILRVFHRLGDRKHPHRNRLKFLIAELGWEGFCAEYERERAAVRAGGAPRLPFEPGDPPVEGPPDSPRRASPAVGEAPEPSRFARWRQTNVRPQRQAGYSVVTATVPLGDLTSGQMRLLAELAEAYSEGQLRLTQEQNLLFRWVRDTDVGPLFARLSAAGLGLSDAATVADVTSCPGAESCRLAVTQSRGLGRVLGDFLRSRPELVAAAPDVKVKISGCPNGCGLHHVAGIGLQGSIRKVGAKPVPQYFLLLGGGVGEGGASFGRIAAKLPARKLTVALERLLSTYASERREGEAGAEFFRRLGQDRVKSLLGDLEELTPDAATSDDYVDLGETHEFKPETMDGECAA